MVGLRECNRKFIKVSLCFKVWLISNLQTFTSFETLKLLRKGCWPHPLPSGNLYWKEISKSTAPSGTSQQTHVDKPARLTLVTDCICQIRYKKK